ncbi:MAG: hypothetical protein AB1486_09155 [Planctomycetota bacterium]
MRKVALVSLAVAAVFALWSTSALADGRNPGSLLVFPIYDSQSGVATVITVTNTNSDFSFDESTGLAKGTVDVEWIYIDGKTCQEFNRTERLTPNDTLSVVAGAHNAQSNLGYLYVFAKHTQTGQPITFNWLIGNEISVNGIETFEYGVNPFVYKGVTAEGTNTDLDGDGILDLDGTEYETSPAELLFPHFFGQSVLFESFLVMINLTGGTKFLASVDFLIYNDNEYQFSAEYEFFCWAVVPLLNISGAFGEAFLDTTDNDKDELVGLPAIETGWFRLDGGVASSSAVTLDDPTILGFLAETVLAFAEADLPFETGKQDNGDLLPRSVHGDP